MVGEDSISRNQHGREFACSLHVWRLESSSGKDTLAQELKLPGHPLKPYIFKINPE